MLIICESINLVIRNFCSNAIIDKADVCTDDIAIA